MRRQHIIEEIRRALGGTATAHAAELALEVVLHSIRDGLQRDGEVKIAGFGSFRVHHAAERGVRHPLTAERCSVAAHRVVKFKAAPSQRRPLPPSESSDPS